MRLFPLTLLLCAQDIKLLRVCMTHPCCSVRVGGVAQWCVTLFLYLFLEATGSARLEMRVFVFAGIFLVNYKFVLL